MACKVIVKSADGTAAGWLLNHFAVGGKRRHPVHPVILRREGDEFVGEIDLQEGVNCIAADVTLGAEIEIDIDPRYRIVQPSGARWPVSAKVPGDMPRDIFPFYFGTGSLQK